MLEICLGFWKSEPRYAYKRYAYKRKNMYARCDGAVSWKICRPIFDVVSLSWKFRAIFNVPTTSLQRQIFKVILYQIWTSLQRQNYVKIRLRRNEQSLTLYWRGVSTEYDFSWYNNDGWRPTIFINFLIVLSICDTNITFQLSSTKNWLVTDNILYRHASLWTIFHFLS